MSVIIMPMLSSFSFPSDIPLDECYDERNFLPLTASATFLYRRTWHWWYLTTNIVMCHGRSFPTQGSERKKKKRKEERRETYNAGYERTKKSYTKGG